MPKISELNELQQLSANDVIAVAHDLNGLPSTNKIQIYNLANTIIQNAPYANTTSPGIMIVGQDLAINSTGFLNSTSSFVARSGLHNQFLLSTGDGNTYWSNNPGLNTLIIENYTSLYTASVDDNYIFCDPNDTGTVTVVLPSFPPEGKEYNIKNLTGEAGFRYVIVTTDQPTQRHLENPETGELIQSYIIANKGDMQTWIHDGSIYRHIGSQTSAPIFITGANTYSQVVIKNTSNGTAASGDLVIYSDQADYQSGTGPFVDLGIDSSQYSSNLYGNVWQPNDAYLYNDQGNLIIGPDSDHTIRFLTNGTNKENVRMHINSTSIFVNSSIIPITNNSISLGSPNYQWSHLYVSNNTIYINNIPLSINDSGKIIVNNIDVVNDVTPFVVQQLTDVTFNAGDSTTEHGLNDIILEGGGASSSITGVIEAGSSVIVPISSNMGPIGYTGSAGTGGSGSGSTLVNGDYNVTLNANGIMVMPPGNETTAGWIQWSHASDDLNNVAGVGYVDYFTAYTGLGLSAPGGGKGIWFGTPANTANPFVPSTSMVFKNDSLYLPENGFIKSHSFYNHGAELSNDGPSITIQTANNTSSQFNWVFGSDGSLTLPGEIHTTAGVGNVVITSSDGESNHTWTFASNGVLIIPDNGGIQNTTGYSVFGGGSSNILTLESLSSGTALNTSKQLHILAGNTSSPQTYTLADGVVGQQVFFIPAQGSTDNAAGSVVITLNATTNNGGNYQFLGSITWYPFAPSTYVYVNSNAATIPSPSAIFDGIGWVISGGSLA